MADERVVLTGEVGEAQRDRAVVVGLHVGEESDVDVAERFVGRLVDPPADGTGEQAQRDHERHHLPRLRLVAPGRAGCAIVGVARLGHHR